MLPHTQTSNWNVPKKKKRPPGWEDGPVNWLRVKSMLCAGCVSVCVSCYHTNSAVLSNWTVNKWECETASLKFTVVADLVSAALITYLVEIPAEGSSSFKNAAGDQRGKKKKKKRVCSCVCKITSPVDETWWNAVICLCHVCTCAETQTRRST